MCVLPALAIEVRRPVPRKLVRPEVVFSGRKTTTREATMKKSWTGALEAFGGGTGIH